jgi:hypothetical protein
MPKGDHPIDVKIDEANAALKDKRTGGTLVTIFRRGDRLHLKGTLLPKPHINKESPYQQSISLGRNATAAEKGLKFALAKAKICNAQLLAGKFDWADWIDLEKVAPKSSSKTIGHWVTEYEENYWQRVKKTPEREVNWRKDHGLVFSRLPKDEELTLNQLLIYIQSTEPDSRSRKRACDYCYKLAEFADLPDREKIKQLTGDYSYQSVDPRTLPTDEAIAAAYQAIEDKAWRWVFGIIATYGLRPHEVFHVDTKDFPTIRILKSKTGKRFALPFYPEWAASWELNRIHLPKKVDITKANSENGTYVSNWISKHVFPAYNLRHSYARRCFEFGIAPDRAAKFMGHSLPVHIGTYRAWIEEEKYVADYQRAIARMDRPMPPS